MSDRLNDLQRQRALAQEQLAWLDREIAREAAALTPAPKSPAPSPAVDDAFHAHLAGMAASAPAPDLTPHADELIEHYAEKGKPVRDQVKQGCLLYLGIAFALVGLGLLALYLNHRLK